MFSFMDRLLTVCSSGRTRCTSRSAVTPGTPTTRTRTKNRTRTDQSVRTVPTATGQRAEVVSCPCFNHYFRPGFVVLMMDFNPSLQEEPASQETVQAHKETRYVLAQIWLDLGTETCFSSSVVLFPCNSFVLQNSATRWPLTAAAPKINTVLLNNFFYII